MHNNDLIDLTTLETALADAIATLELEGDANAPELFESDDALAHVSLEQIEAGWGLDKEDRGRFTKREREARGRYMDKMRKRRKRAMDKRSKADKVRDSKPVDQVRVRALLNIIGLNLLDVITDTVIARYNRFRRVMGDVSVGDLANDTVLAIAESLARSEADLVEIAQAALWLSAQPKPIDTAQDDAPARARMLMGTIIRKAGHSIVDTYRKSTCTMWVQTVGDEGQTEWVQKDVTLESLDYLLTMERATSSDVDTLLSAHKAGGKPKHESSAPNRAAARSFARMVVDYAITARGLDWLTDLMLEGMRTDGAFTWSKHADEVWAGLGMPEVDDMKPEVKVAYAKRAARMAFEFLPDVIATAYEIASQPEVLAQFTYMTDTNVHTYESDRHTGTFLVQFPPSMEREEKALDNGARVFLEGMNDGDAPVQLREGPDQSEWKRVFSSDESPMECAHGKRQSVKGMSKKAGKHPRRWQGEFCSAPKGAQDACEPIFHHGKIAGATPAQALSKIDLIIEAVASSA